MRTANPIAGWILVKEPEDVLVEGIGYASKDDFIFHYKEGQKLLHPSVISRIPKRIRGNKGKIIEFLRDKKLSNTVGKPFKGDYYGVPASWIEGKAKPTKTDEVTRDDIKALANRKPSTSAVSLGKIVDCPICGAELKGVKTLGTIRKEGMLPSVGDVYAALNMHTDWCPIKESRSYETEDELRMAWGTLNK